MPQRAPSGSRGVYVALPEDLIAALRALAGRNKRPFRAEMIHALQRHLEAPPTVSVSVEVNTPPLSPEVVRVEEPPPKKRRGRK